MEFPSKKGDGAMRWIRNSVWVVIAFTMFFCSVSPALAQQKYALLISAGRTTNDDVSYHSEFWYDLFLMYRMLAEAGFTHNNIFVLYGNGNDFNSTHANYQVATFFPGLGQITDFANSKADVDSIFNWLANGNAAMGVPQLQDGDFLFYWWMGHGSTQAGMPDCDYEASIQNTGEKIRDTEFAAYFARLPACQIKAMYVMTCHSGGLVGDLEGLHRMIHTAAPCNANAFSTAFDVWHADFSYHAACAFREQDPVGAAIASDTDGDGLVSCEETNNHAHTNTTSSTTQIGDYRNIAPLIFVDNAQPASTVPRAGVYSRDYAEDNGTEPSEWMTHVWYKGPDLWVRNAQDGVTDHQDPEYGQTNYVYARVHNIDCASTNVDVKLSWCLVSAWSNPASWNTISSFTESNLASSESRVVSAPWTTVPVPGKYCLHTELNAPGDLENADGCAYMDNNKVQINVTVENFVWGWSKHFYWLVENGLDKPATIDLVVEKLRGSPIVELGLKLPADLKFKRVIGGEVKRTPEGLVVVALPKTSRLILQGVPLRANAKHDAVLSLMVPRDTKIGQAMGVKISERMNGREMGGIIVDLKAVSKFKFMGDFLKDARTFFQALNDQFKIRGAAEIARIFDEAGKGIYAEDFKAMEKALAGLPALQPRVSRDLAKIMTQDERARFELNMKVSLEAVRARDWAAFTASMEEGMGVTRRLFLAKMEK
jgi:hypothetical protein